MAKPPLSMTAIKRLQSAWSRGGKNGKGKNKSRSEELKTYWSSPEGVARRAKSKKAKKLAAGGGK